MVLRILTIPPGSVCALARTTVANGVAGDGAVFLILPVLEGPRQQTGTQKIGIMDRILENGGVAKTIPGLSRFARERENPPADAFRDIEKLRIKPLLIGF